MARVSGDAAQTPFNVRTNWAQFNFATNHNGLNPYENVLSPSTVGNLGLRWSYPTGNRVASSPAVANGVVYAGSLDNNVYALNATTEAQLWQFATGNIVISSPAVANGAVYVGSFDNNVYALNAATGAKLWQFTTGNSVWSSPAVANGVVYVGSFDNNVYALLAGTGAKLWQFTTGNYVACLPRRWSTEWSTSVHTTTMFLCPERRHRRHAVAIHHRGVRGLFPGSVERAGLGAGVQGIDIGVKRTDVGAKVWQFTTGNSIDTSPAVANGVVYVSSGDNNVYALNASTGAKLWQTAVYLGTDAAVANGVVYVGSGDNNVYALNASTGAELWQFTTGSFVESSPVVANGVVYVGSDDNNIYAFKMTNPAEAPARPDPATLRPNLGLGK